MSIQTDLELRKYGRAAKDFGRPQQKLRSSEPIIQDSIGRGPSRVAKAASEVILSKAGRFYERYERLRAVYRLL
jgi:hypothetical protein